MNPETNEYELALRARTGDLSALAELIEQTRLRLFQLAFADLRNYDDARDAVASALLQICLHIRELRDPTRIRPWMNSIVRNEARRLQRGNSSRLLPLDDMELPTAGCVPSLLALDIELALRQLPEEHSRALRWFYLSDLSIREIAERTGRSTGTIKSWLHRGRRQLALEMESYAPMTTTSNQTNSSPEQAPRIAALLHGGLAPTALDSLTEALKIGGYATSRFQPDDMGDLNMRSIQFIETLKPFQLIVLDDHFGPRHALEYVLNLKANAETKWTPLCLLTSEATDFFAGSAYFTAGVDKLIHKEKLADASALAQTFARPRSADWDAFTGRARQIIRSGVEEAQKGYENYVATEHLLLGLVRDSDSVGSRMLRQLGVEADAVRAEIAKQAEKSAIAAGMVAVSGTLDMLPDRWGYLRNDSAEPKRDVYVSEAQIGVLGLKAGDVISGKARGPQGSEKNYILLTAEVVNGKPVPTELPQGLTASNETPRDMQLTPRSKRVIDLAYDEARLAMNSYIGTEHLLLAMIRETASCAGMVFAVLGVSLERARSLAREIQAEGNVSPAS